MRQNESGRRLFLVGGLVACLPRAADADNGALDPGEVTFRDFAVFDIGASFTKVDTTFGANAANPQPSRVLAIDNNNGLARIRYDTIRAEVSLPLGWQATEDWERGVGYSGDKRYRLIVWRVDFAFEGVNDAEHYASTKSGTIQARRDRRAKKPITVFDLVMSKPGNPKEGVLMTLGAPASDAERGLKLLALLKSKLIIDW